MHGTATPPRPRSSRGRGWRALLVLVVLAASIGASLILTNVTATIYHVGLHPHVVRVDNHDSSIDTGDLEKRLARTQWGRRVDLYVAIAARTQPPTPQAHVDNLGITRYDNPGARGVVTCSTTDRTYQRQAFPELRSAPNYSTPVVYLCVDPYSGQYVLEEATTAGGRSAYDVQARLERILVHDDLDADAIVGALQDLAQAEAGDDFTTNVPRSAAVMLGIIIGIVALWGIDSLRQTMTRPRSSRATRRKMAERVSARFEEASLGLDDLALHCLTTEGNLDKRFEAWKLRYTQLCAELADDHDDKPLWARSRYERLLYLDRLSAIVDEGRDALLAEAGDDAGADSARASLEAALRAALNEVDVLANALTIGKDSLQSSALGWRHRFDVATRADDATAFAAYTDLANDIESGIHWPLARYARDRGQTYPRTDVFAVPGQILGLDLVPADDVTGSPGAIDNHAILKQARQTPQNHRTLSGTGLLTPLTPRAMAIAVLVAFVIGILSPLLQMAWESESATWSPGSVYASASPALPGAGYLPERASDTALRHPASVTIDDPDGLVKSADVLRENLSHLGFATAASPDIVVAVREIDACSDEANIDLSRCLSPVLKPVEGAASLPTDRAYVPVSETGIVVVVLYSDSAERLIPYVFAGEAKLRGNLDKASYHGASGSPRIVMSNSAPDLLVWNGLVATAHISRGITTAGLAPIARTRIHPLVLGVCTGGAALIAFVIVGGAASAIHRSRSRTRAMAARVDRYLTRAVMDTDRLELEVLSLSTAYPAYESTLNERWQRWTQNLNRALAVAGRGSEGAGPLDEQARLAQLVSLQQASLWRVRSILSRGPGWRHQWEREVMTCATLAPTMNAVDQHALIQLSESVLTDRYGGTRALRQLDRMATQWRATAIVRGLDDVSDHLSEEDLGWRALTDIPDTARYRAPGWARLSTPGDWGRWIVVLIIVGALTWASIGTYSPTERRVTSWTTPVDTTSSYKPASITVTDPGNLFDERAVAHAAETTRLPAPFHLVITSAQAAPHDVLANVDGYQFPGLLAPTISPNADALPRTIAIIVYADHISIEKGVMVQVSPEAQAVIDSPSGNDHTQQLTRLLATSLVTS
ncbi:hypothetical protein H8R18_02640 [Nanchangia anserum]|uniref:Uncharacterized protein n=1 Tax=Nanchangia anserum TaxID=2692125 RepID=A0A8I0GEA6_9ACTO|nr:hypothetical protein [Nanchangia anserum]MBD3689928.1 hypothetical protein [Nanchangia anserum]QOX82257.1 hypothetical protein H8R18_02640 [Nanchangia anserum]